MTIGSTPTVFRLLAWQPLSFALEDVRPFDMTVQQMNCQVSIRPAEKERSEQISRGGTFIGIDFRLSDTGDLVIATHKGLELLEDVLSAIALVEGTTVGALEPVQIVRAESASQCTFIR